ncbi:MAG: hypothetical protein QM779_11825 [Propionicimonas sp.]|uniref:hypothetical protein n=1 Tax=Propionicimonas sp. TaxID=1955623 RepID=UPI003D0C4403
MCRSPTCRPSTRYSLPVVVLLAVEPAVVLLAVIELAGVLVRVRPSSSWPAVVPPVVVLGRVRPSSSWPVPRRPGGRR